MQATKDTILSIGYPHALGVGASANSYRATIVPAHHSWEERTLCSKASIQAILLYRILFFYFSISARWQVMRWSYSCHDVHDDRSYVKMQCTRLFAATCLAHLLG